MKAGRPSKPHGAFVGVREKLNLEGERHADTQTTKGSSCVSGGGLGCLGWQLLLPAGS